MQAHLFDKVFPSIEISGEENFAANISLFQADIKDTGVGPEKKWQL